MGKIRNNKEKRKKPIISALFICLLVLSLFQIGMPIVPAAEEPHGQDPGSGGGSGSDWWSMFHHDLARTGATTSAAPDTVNVLWQFETDNQIRSSPAVVNERLYVASTSGTLYCLNAENGSEIWSQTLDIIWQSSPTVNQGKIYIGSIDDHIYCLDADDGAILWDVPTGDWILSSPAFYQDKIYIGSYDGSFYCLNATDGTENWIADIGSIWSSPAIENNRVYVGGYEGTMYCLNADSGQVIWTNETPNGVIVSSPAISDGKVFIGSNDKYVYCFDTDDGSVLWQTITVGIVQSSPAVSDGIVYVGSGPRVYALNATTGQRQWSTPTGGDVDSSPAIADGKLYVGSMEGMFYCLDTETGNEIWTYDEIGPISWASPAVVNGRVYIGSDDHSVYCFRENNPPMVPDDISGPTQGGMEEPLVFSTNTADPDGDDVYYQWDWDGNISTWLGPYESGEIHQASYAWMEEGTYTIKVKAKDIYNDESTWSPVFEVTISTPLPSLDIDAPSSVIEGSSFFITVTSNGFPIGNVSIDFADEIYHTGNNGMVSLLAPEVEKTTEYLIHANKSGYQDDSIPITILDHDPDTEKGWIFGNVVSSEMQVALEDVQIQITIGDISWTTYTNSEGDFFQAIPPGSYTLTASLHSYITYETTFNVQDLQAIQLPIVLIETHESSVEEPELNYVDLTIQQKGSEGIIGARMDIESESKESIIYFSDEFNIDLQITEESITCIIEADEDVPGTIIVIYIKEGALTDITNLQVTYDGVAIDQAINSEGFFNLEDTSIPQWLRHQTIDGDEYIFIQVPSFSEHTITISSLTAVLSTVTAILFYIAICLIAGILFLSHALSGPVIRFLVKRKK